MKNTIIAPFLVALGLATFVCRSNADLIDLGERDLPARLPGVTATMAYIEADQGLPPGTLVYLNAFDEDDGFYNNGAVDSSHFDVTLTDGNVNGNVSWDLTGTGYQLSYVLLKDGHEGGSYLYHLYGVTADEVFNSDGDQFVTVNGVRYITYLSFFGVPSSVPEAGMTLVLLGIALCALAAGRRLLPRFSA